MGDRAKRLGGECPLSLQISSIREGAPSFDTPQHIEADGVNDGDFGTTQAGFVSRSLPAHVVACPVGQRSCNIGGSPPVP